MRGIRWMAVALTICCASPAVAVSAPLQSHASAKKKHGGKKKKAPVTCKLGQARVQAGKRVICVKNTLPVTHATPQQAQAATALALQLAGTRDKRRRRAPQLAQLLRRGRTTLQSLEQTISTGLARGQTLALASALGRTAHASAAAPIAWVAAACGNNPELEAKRKEYEEAPPAEKEKADKEMAEVKSGFKNGELEANVDIESGAIKLGIDTKSKGIRIDLSLRSCGGEGLQLDSCPTAQGKVEGHDTSETEALFKVSEGSKLLFLQGIKMKGETTIKAQTGDDGKLDSYDIKHVYSLAGSFGGSKAKFGPITVDTTYIGEAHIDMRSGSQEAPPAVVDVMTTMEGVDPAERIKVEIELAHKSQTAADKEFSAEVDKATAKLRSREAGWLKPNACASLHFEPASETIKLKKGQSGTFKSTVEANGGGAPPAATWILGAQKNASFTPAPGSANPLSTSYNVTNSGKGVLVEATVKATSKAGVAEGTWKQKTGEVLKTISGTFSGRIENNGSLIQWSGTATFERIEIAGADPEVAATFQLTSGQAEVTASGFFQGADCTQSGSTVASIQPLALWTVEHRGETTEYQAIAPWDPTAKVPVTLSHCNPSSLNGQPEELVLDSPAIQSGPVLGDISHVSPDGTTFEGEASEESVGENYSWSWSFKGSF